MKGFLKFEALATEFLIKKKKTENNYSLIYKNLLYIYIYIYIKRERERERERGRGRKGGRGKEKETEREKEGERVRENVMWCVKECFWGHERKKIKKIEKTEIVFFKE